MYVRIDVEANAKRETVTQTDESTFSVRVREKAERNMANKRVVELIREHFGGAGTQVRLISGHHSPRKIVSVEIGKKE